MGKKCLIFVLLTSLYLSSYGQDLEKGDQSFQFIEVGAGGVYTRQIHGAVNVALSNGLGRHFANFIDYNLAFGKSSTLFHEISFKLGPFYRFNSFSYIAVSSGISFIYNSEPISENGFNNYYYTIYSEPDYLINIPIQAKLNIGVYKGCCIGFKGTYNKMIDKAIEDKGTVLMYLAWGW